MGRMKEENKVLRMVVEQTMKEYYDLQVKYQNHQVGTISPTPEDTQVTLKTLIT